MVPNRKGQTILGKLVGLFVALDAGVSRYPQDSNVESSAVKIDEIFLN